MAVVPLGFHQIGVRAELGDAAVIHDDNMVALPQRAKAVSDNQRCAALHGLLHRCKDFMLGVRVDCSRGIVEKQNGRVQQNGAGDGQSLTLAS
jgi:hypothetical protein